jgi:hypothetical protein
MYLRGGSLPPASSPLRGLPAPPSTGAENHSLFAPVTPPTARPVFTGTAEFTPEK